jgi:hypothetical protein
LLHFVAGHHVVHFYCLQNQDLFQDLSTEMWYLFVYCKLFYVASTWKTIIPTLLTLFPFPLFIVFKLSFKTTFNSFFFPFYVILHIFQGTQQQKTGLYGNPQHTFFTNGIYFVQKNIVFTSQSRIFLWCREHLCNWPKNQSFAQW